MLLELVAQWPGNNAFNFHQKLVPAHGLDAGPMPIPFEYFLIKDLRYIKMASRVDCVVRYMSETVLKAANDYALNAV